MAAPVQTIATPVLQNLPQTDRVVDENFDRVFSFLRAMKIFLISFPEFLSNNCSANCAQKFETYLKEMQSLYGVQTQDLAFLHQLEEQLNTQLIEITVGVKRFAGRDRAMNTRIVVNNSLSESNPIFLNPNSEEQNNAFYFQTIGFNYFRQFGQQNRAISIRLEAENWVQNEEELREFQINFREIHSQGFENWFHFGRGVQLLIKIEFRVSNEPNITEEYVSYFHFQTILYMIRYRLWVYRADQTKKGTGHKPNTYKSKMSYIRGRIVPNSEQAFWSTPKLFAGMPTIVQNIVGTDPQLPSEYMRERIVNQTIEFNDLQIGYGFADEFDDSVCLCSEWCNWNAFFYHNPIYRFLLVRHNQMYLTNRANIPDMYFYVSVFCINESAINLQINQSLPNTPLLKLMLCANEYKNKFFQNYYLRDQYFRDLFNRSRPVVTSMSGLAYDSLRYGLRITELCMQSHPNPFSDACIESLTIYYKVFSDLHQFISRVDAFIDRPNCSLWFEEFDKISRNEYKIYIKRSYIKRNSVPDNRTDYLFTKEYEYSDTLAITEGQIEAVSVRSFVFHLGSVDNPFNVRVICNPFIDSFISIHDLIQKLDSALPSIKTKDSLHDVFECLKTFDTDFTTYANTKSFHFEVDDEVLNQRHLQHLRKEFYIFYTLKLYSIGYGIQRKCINCLIQYNRRHFYNFEKIASEFVFIFRNELIEHKFRDLYPNEMIYDINNQIQITFTDFYDNYWGRAAHETAFLQLLVPNIMDSVYFQYQRLYHWWRSDGNNTLKFRRIFDAFDDSLGDVFDRTEDLFETHFVPLTQELCQRCEVWTEIMDTLVYYLVKANCYMILNVLNTFLVHIHLRRTPLQVYYATSYSLSKPGWVQIFSTMRTVFYFVDLLKTYYIVFDDEFNRIAKTLLNTKEMIKNIYRDFYKKLCHEWVAEMTMLYELQVQNQTLLNLLALHLSVGVSFLANSLYDFRSLFANFRKKYEKLMARIPNPILGHQLYFGQLYAVCVDYLCDDNAIEEGMPFLSNHWENEFFNLFNDFNQNTEQYLHLFVNEANI